MYGNCILCNNYAKLNRLYICSDCFPIDEQLLQLARDMIQAEGRMSVFELADKLSVPYERIFLWIQQRRLKPGQFRYNCPVCGKDLLYSFCDCMKNSYASESSGRHGVHPEKFYSALRIHQRRNYYWDHESRIRRKQKRDIWLPT
ncbi:MAG: hypothetical protein AB1656_14710 [Candidatus Omnitrophota bacterium]